MGKLGLDFNPACFSPLALTVFSSGRNSPVMDRPAELAASRLVSGNRRQYLLA